MTTYVYDALGRTELPAREITTPGNVIMTYYDTDHGVIGIETNTLGNPTLYLYDAGSRLLIDQINLPGGTTSLLYDPVSDQLLVSVVPEPSTLGLAGIAIALCEMWMRRRQRS